MHVSQDELSRVSMRAVREKHIFFCLLKVFFATSYFYFCEAFIIFLVLVKKPRWILKK